MTDLDYGNVLKAGPKHGIAADELEQEGKKIAGFLKKIAARKQGFCDVVDDADMLEHLQELTAELQEKEYEDIVVLGIGGSALGLRAIYGALDNPLTVECPRLTVLDNVDPEGIARLTEYLDMEKTLFMVITKSGGTPETLSEYFYFRKLVEAAGLDPRVHFVFITDPGYGLLRQIAGVEGIRTMPVPPNVGGRFSVLTAVGLLPASLMGWDVKAMLEGARGMRDQFLNKKFEQNMPFRLAAVQHLLGTRGKTNVVLMPYGTGLGTFALWYAQLLAESTGKVNAKGKHVGLTPIAAVGVTDQHSQLQLFVQGPNDKQLIFVVPQSWESDPEIPVLSESEGVQFLQGVSFGQLLQTEATATADTLTEAQRPNMTLSIPRVDARTLGELFMLFEGATAFLGEFLEIDAFNQPGVERSKILTKEYLSEQ